MLWAKPRSSKLRAALPLVDLAVLMQLALFLTGFGSVVDGSHWRARSWSVMAAVALACLLMRGLSRGWMLAGGLIAVFVSLSWAFASETTFLGIPMPDSLISLVRLGREAAKSVAAETSPVEPSTPIVFLVTAAMSMVVLATAYLLFYGNSAWVGLLFVALYVTPTAISGHNPSWFLFAAAACTWLWMLRSTARGPSKQIKGLAGPRRRSYQAISVIAGIALGASVLLPPLMPESPGKATTWSGQGPALFGRGINPMLNLGQNLRRGSTVTQLEYSTDYVQPPYLKVATLRDFNGKTWRPSPRDANDRFEGQVGLDSGIEREPRTSSIQVIGLRSSMLPVPYPALEVEGLKGDWQWERRGMTVSSDSTTTLGQNYQVKSLDIRPTAEQMRERRTLITGTLQPYLELPEQMPGIITKTAAEVTAGSANDYDRAKALQDYLRNGPFSYSETAPVAEGYDGNGVDVIAEFLVRGQGYCVHFASSLAVMARSVGLPARIAVGYAPGVLTRIENNRNVYSVTSDDLHAWTEIYFDGVGWVSFDATPGVGSPTAFAEPISGSASNEDDTAAAPQLPRPSEQGETALRADSPEIVTNSSHLAWYVLFGMGALTFAPAGARIWLRRRRLRSAKPELFWAEVRGTARDLGLAMPDSQTVRHSARELKVFMEDESVADLDQLVDVVERDRYAPTRIQTVEPADVRKILTSLRRNSSPARRLRAALAPKFTFQGVR